MALNIYIWSKILDLTKLSPTFHEQLRLWKRNLTECNSNSQQICIVAVRTTEDITMLVPSGVKCLAGFMVD